jgi:hypothetical protein
MCLIACRRAVPTVDTAPKLTRADGTISGSVRGAEASSPIKGRVVEAISVESGERQRVTTNTAGGFSFKLKPGRYRVELALRDGESVVKRPGVIDLSQGGANTQADFVVGTVHISRPRYPLYRIDTGLGAPIA